MGSAPEHTKTFSELIFFFFLKSYFGKHIVLWCQAVCTANLPLALAMPRAVVCSHQGHTLLPPEPPAPCHPWALAAPTGAEHSPPPKGGVGRAGWVLVDVDLPLGLQPSTKWCLCWCVLQACPVYRAGGAAPLSKSVVPPPLPLASWHKLKVTQLQHPWYSQTQTQTQLSMPG